MTSAQIVKKYLDFFKKQGHVQIPNVSIVPENDPTLLYVNSGMFPLVPYLTGQPHPSGKRLVNIQRCMRFFEDIDNIGVTNRHTTAFHMLGNWSLNDYFKKEQLNWKYQFYIEELGLDPKYIYGTVFKGNKHAPKDEESIAILKEIFSKYGIEAKEGERIFAIEKDNWWQRGDAPGELGGPSSEIFYYLGKDGKDGTGLGLNLPDYEDDFLEIGNSVFMEYQKNNKGGWDKIKQHNVDFGGGLERLALVLQGKTDIYQTDNFWPVVEELEKLSRLDYESDPKITKAMRVIADHMRSATFLAMDGVTPSNKDLGYILRRVLRRMVRFSQDLKIQGHVSSRLVPTVAEMFNWLYPDLKNKEKDMIALFEEEEAKFTKTLNRVRPRVIKELEIRNEKLEIKDGKQKINEKELAEIAFNLYQSEGYPPEMLTDDAEEYGLKIDPQKYEKAYKELFKKHQEISRKGAEKKFKGGLADQSRETTQYHTVTHLLHEALRQVLGNHISQKGSNITGERLRFDFPHDQALTEKQIKKVEDKVNEIIAQKLPVQSVTLPKEEALKTGAYHAFDAKYGDKITVYFVGQDLKTAFSKEFCGGPHVKNSSELKPIEIYKQESVGKGVRRVYVRFK